MPKSDQGVTPDRYKVIPRTLIFLTRDDGKVLLLKGAPDKHLWADLYNGIGGHIERGEDVLSSARRELLEETGLVAEDLWLCGVVMVDASDTVGVGIYVVRGEYASGELSSSEEGKLEWVDPAGVESLPLVEDLRVLLPRVLAMKQGDIPFSAVYTYDRDENLQIEFGVS